MGLLGAHMSIAGGLHLAIERGDSLQCEAIQIFVQSSRTWKQAPLSEEAVGLFRQTAKKAKHVKRIVAHNSYLLNLSTSNDELREKSVGYFIQLMESCERLGIESLITHPGSHLGVGEEIGIRKTAESLNQVLKATQGNPTQVLLENTAGQGGCVGCSFEQLASITEQVKYPERIFYCFDTQHAFAAGYDLRTSEGYETVFEKWNTLLGVDRIRTFHVNDALKELGCRVDRHANIGKGFLGKNAFAPLVRDKRFKNTPMCLETDPGDEMVNYKKELKMLKELAKKS